MVNIVTNKSLLTVAQVAELLGISRIAVFKRIQKGELPAQKYGRLYLIDKKDLPNIFSTTTTEKQKAAIISGVAKTTQEYGLTLKLLGKEEHANPNNW